MQELKKKHRKKPKKELERGAQKEQKNLTDITEEQLKVNIGIVRLGNMIKVIQIVMKVLCFMKRQTGCWRHGQICLWRSLSLS